MSKILFYGSIAAAIFFGIGIIVNPNYEAKRNPPKDKDVVIIYLEDGTRCALYRKHYRGGLSCDWNGKKKGDL